MPKRPSPRDPRDPRDPKRPKPSAPVASGPTLQLTSACWPVFDFLTHFLRQVEAGTTSSPDEVRYKAATALRDAEDLARNDSVTERLWSERVKAMMVYLLDYKMQTAAWDGRTYWLDQPLETDRTLLDHPQALGGEYFFQDCEDVQREFQLAEDRNRHDKDELAELLSLYFVCLRLGFRGQYHDRPQELADYTRRLYSRLPAYSTTRGREMFPDVLKHNIEKTFEPPSGVALSVVLATFGLIIVSALVGSRWAWNNAVGEIKEAAQKWRNDKVTVPGLTAETSSVAQSSASAKP